MIAFLLRFVTLLRTRPLIAGCLVVAAAAGGANLYLWLERGDAALEHEEMRQRGQAMLTALADRVRIHADRAALEEALGQVDRNLVSEESMEVNLGYFYRLEKLSRVRLARIDQLVAAPPEPGSPYKAVPVALQVTGTYRQILSFMRELETGPRLLRMRDYRLERTGESGDLLLQLTVELLARP